MITVYVIAYNEQMFIKFMIDHYRFRFPNCKIVVYDNMSTDNTVNIALENNCEVIKYDTNNTIMDSKYLEIKNNCWKNSETDWVLICDMDELLDINEEQLRQEENLGTTVIKSEAYNMVNMEDNYDLSNIKYGSRCSPYDKIYLFNKKHIKEINYSPGCHNTNIIGANKPSNIIYKLYHYKCVHPEYQVQRYRLYSSRLSKENLQNKWGNHYQQTDDQIRQTFYLARTYVTKIIP